jgi:hypothetical protein
MFHVIHRGPGVLAQGGIDAALRSRGSGWGVIVLAAQERQPDRRIFAPWTRVVYAPIDDAILTPREAYTAEIASAIVADALRAGQSVMSTCAQGRNRSGLVSALALTKLHGWSGARATDHVRAARPGALTNPSFLRYLETVSGQ